MTGAHAEGARPPQRGGRRPTAAGDPRRPATHGSRHRHPTPDAVTSDPWRPATMLEGAAGQADCTGRPGWIVRGHPTRTKAPMHVRLQPRGATRDWCGALPG